MRIVLNYTLNINHLLTNNSLLELSFNQILDFPNNLFFHISLGQKFKNNKKLILLNKIKKLLKNEKQYIINFIKFYIKNKKRYFILKNFLITNLIIKQLIANILNKIFEFHLIKKLLPFNCYYIANSNIKAHKKLNLLLKKVNFGFQFDKLVIFDKIKIVFILKIIEQQIFDTRFINFLKKLFLIVKKTKITFDKSSKFYKIICDIYLSQFDYFLIKLFKNKTVNTLKLYKLYNTFLKTSLIELLISKALTIKRPILSLQYILNLKNKKKQLYYMRYFDNIFIGGSLSNLTNLKLVFELFFKSNLYFKISILNYSQNLLDFLAVKKKKFHKISFKKKLKCFNIFIKNFTPIKLVKEQLLILGLIKKDNKSKIMAILINLYTKSIIIWYNFFYIGVLMYYKQTFNYKKLIYNLKFFVKWSLLYTLRKKHKKSLYRIIIKYWKKNIKFNSLSFYKKKLIKFLILNHIKSNNNFLIGFWYIYQTILHSNKKTLKKIAN